MKFAEVEPFGEWMADVRMALAVANILSPHMKPGAKVTSMDFMTPFYRPKNVQQRSQSQAEIKAITKHIAKAWSKKRG